MEDSIGQCNKYKIIVSQNVLIAYIIRLHRKTHFRFSSECGPVKFTKVDSIVKSLN